MDNNIIANLADVRRRISLACKSSGRNPTEVRLLLATKTVAAEQIRLALQQGEMLIGENKVQELRYKFDELSDIVHEKHFIGHLQSNKIKDVIRYGVTCIESLDNIELAGKVNQYMEKLGKTMDVLIQVNTSGEDSKFGIAPADALELVREVSNLKHLRVRGLMTIGLFSSEMKLVRRCFTLLRSIQQEIRSKAIAGVDMKELSMGMSGDLETAIAEGATIVRVGTAIFGRRIHPDSYYWNENP